MMVPRIALVMGASSAKDLVMSDDDLLLWQPEREELRAQHGGTQFDPLLACTLPSPALSQRP